MAKGLSLHIGLNAIDPKHYGGWKGKLLACENDARAMQKLAERAGFRPTTLLTRRATRKSVFKQIEKAAEKLRSGDYFLITYAGHGSQIKDKSGDEDDAKDETWLLYDAQVLDDELHRQYGKFKKGVRIMIVSDSCHSGTISGFAKPTKLTKKERRRLKRLRKKYRVRYMDQGQAYKTYQQNQAFYDKLLTSLKDTEADQVQASIRLLSAAQDHQLASDGRKNGLFTRQLLKTWRRGRFNGGLKDFHKQIRRRLSGYDQDPNLLIHGRVDKGERPFDI